MTKEKLEQYLDICEEIEELKNQKITDVVRASSQEYPYGIHSVNISGTDEAKAKMIGKLMAEKAEIESFINSLETSRERRIVYFRIQKGLSWDQVAAKVKGKYSVSQCKSTYYGIFKKTSQS